MSSGCGPNTTMSAAMRSLLPASAAAGEAPELRLVQQRDPVTFLAEPLDLHQLQAGVPSRRLQRVRPAADDDRRLRRRHAVDERAGAAGGADGVAAASGQD